jgi:hypothetical protein
MKQLILVALALAAGFYHDGRFATLAAVVNHYDSHLHTLLTEGEKADLVEYLKSLLTS